MGQQYSSYKVVPMANFNASAYMGKWLELARTRVIYEIGCENSWAEYYDLDPQKGTFMIQNHCGGPLERDITGKATKRNKNDTSASFLVSFSAISRIFPESRGTYNVLATDYVNFSIVSDDSGRAVWLLGRNKTSPNDPLLIKFISEIQKKTKVNPRNMIWSLTM